MIRTANTDVFAAKELRNAGVRIVDVTSNDRLLRADDDTGRLEAKLSAVSTEVAFCSGIGRGIDVEGIVRAGLHARLAADAAPRIEIDDTVGPPEEGAGGADLDARGILAVVAALDEEVPPGIGELSFFDIFHPCPEDANGNVVFRFASDSTGVTADAPPLVDDKTVPHSSLLFPLVDVSLETAHGRVVALERPCASPLHPLALLLFEPIAPNTASTP